MCNDKIIKIRDLGCGVLFKFHTHSANVSTRELHYDIPQRIIWLLRLSHEPARALDEIYFMKNSVIEPLHVERLTCPVCSQFIIPANSLEDLKKEWNVLLSFEKIGGVTGIKQYFTESNYLLIEE